jgi:hypothetical protein
MQDSRLKGLAAGVGCRWSRSQMSPKPSGDIAASAWRRDRLLDTETRGQRESWVLRV